MRYPRHIQPIVHSRDPWLITIDDFLTPDEADRIIQLGSTHWGRSIAGDGVQAVRTSSTAWCEHSGCGTDPVVKDIRRRIMELTGVPEENAEHLQILRYQSGQFYKRHHDQNAPSASAWGPRLYTFYMYLNDVDEVCTEHCPHTMPFFRPGWHCSASCILTQLECCPVPSRPSSMPLGWGNIFPVAQCLSKAKAWPGCYVAFSARPQAYASRRPHRPRGGRGAKRHQIWSKLLVAHVGLPASE